MTSKRSAVIFCWLVTMGLLLAGCGPGSDAEAGLRMPGGDPERGRVAIRAYGCPACHTIPGIARATATVGPPLDDWANRHFIAGSLPNTPENLLWWIQYPQEVEPGTAMPNMGIGEQEARNIGAYLYTLRRD